MDSGTIAYVFAAFFLAAFAKGVTGLGFSTLSLLLLAIALEPTVSIPLVIVPSLCSNVLVMIGRGLSSRGCEAVLACISSCYPWPRAGDKAVANAGWCDRAIGLRNRPNCLCDLGFMANPSSSTKANRSIISCTSGFDNWHHQRFNRVSGDADFALFASFQARA